MLKEMLLTIAVSAALVGEPLEVTVVETGLNADEIDILAQLTMAEAESESELGQRLVIDTVLNRMESDDFPDDLQGVIHQKGAFSCIKNGRYDRCKPTECVKELVREEIVSRSNSEVLYFNARGYTYGDPICKEGRHYFSGKDNKNE